MTQARATHVRWEDHPAEQLNDKLERRYLNGETMTLARFFLARGCLVPSHHHENEQFSFVLSGCLRFRLGADSSEVVDVKAGEVILLPAHLPHSAEALEDTVVSDSFCPIRKDWLANDDAYLRR